MIQACALVIFFYQISLQPVKTNEISLYNRRHVSHIMPRSLLTSIEKFCLVNNKWIECAARNNFYNKMNSISRKIIGDKVLPHYVPGSNTKIRELHSNIKSHLSEPLPIFKSYMQNPTVMLNIRPYMTLPGTLPIKPYPIHRPGLPNQLPRPDVNYNMNYAWNTPLHPHTTNVLSSPVQSTQVNSSSIVSHNRLKPLVTMTTAISGVSQQTSTVYKNLSAVNKFTQSLDDLERRFYKITFTKLTTISPVDRQENGMSFVQSGFFLLLTLMALWTDVDSVTKIQIDQSIGFNISDMNPRQVNHFPGHFELHCLGAFLVVATVDSGFQELQWFGNSVDSVGLVRHFITTLPNSSDKLKLRQSSRLMLWPGKIASPLLQGGAALALKLQVEQFNGTETSDTIADLLNKKVEMDSGGAIHDTFDEDDVSGGVTAVLVSTLYVRARWRAAPTVLNGTMRFLDADDAPRRTVRMMRINDVMSYADLSEWDAQALEISYATPGLTLLMLMPRGNSLKALVDHVGNTSIGHITEKMRTMRVAATVPIYTLRMTLLLPNKLQALGIPRLVDTSNVTEASSLRLSHAVQRIMFWAEPGRNAYKDDGIEWDQVPELEVVVNRPYIFFVRWRNVTLINGNFVL